MKFQQSEFRLQTSRRSEFVDITSKVREKISESGVSQGLCLVYSPHTSSGMTINQGVEPDVTPEIVEQLNKCFPWEDQYHHHEGNCACHVKTTIIGTSEKVIIKDGKILLGDCERIFFSEFNGPRPRVVFLEIIGE
ncbi:MAG: secondary thiamine-phosphate synthase enzyme YjbQ [Candidatus Eremiobacteraeota bacterium]|nr:secondary thiamine-phosphate synthase enzyme YjbQ [Candidatus Eremiobacteraeota bacterium]